MTDYISGYEGNGHYQREARDVADRLRSEATITEGVIRWNSNGTVPPIECVALAAHIGLPVDATACDRVRDAETTAFLAEYRKNQRGRKPSAEERFGLRAAHGRGARVVNVLTGRTTRT
jgi:hypothetical protein